MLPSAIFVFFCRLRCCCCFRVHLIVENNNNNIRPSPMSTAIISRSGRRRSKYIYRSSIYSFQNDYYYCFIRTDDNSLYSLTEHNKHTHTSNTILMSLSTYMYIILYNIAPVSRRCCSFDSISEYAETRE